MAEYKNLNPELIQMIYGVEPKIFKDGKHLKFQLENGVLDFFQRKDDTFTVSYENKLSKELDDLNKKLDSIEQPKIFIVYGHDGKLKNEVVRLLKSWKFEPVLIEKKKDGANHIIDKLIPLINGSIAGIVLATPDDIGFAKDKILQPKKRWRQNVVLELGMLIAAKGLKNTYIVSQEDKDMERPSDIEGLYRDAVEFEDNKLVNKIDLLNKLFKYHENKLKINN